MEDLSSWGMLAALVVGPGGGVWMGVRAAIEVLRRENLRQSEQLERQSALLAEINTHLERLNSRVSKSEDHIEGLEKREGNG